MTEANWEIPNIVNAHHKNLFLPTSVMRFRRVPIDNQKMKQSSLGLHREQLLCILSELCKWSIYICFLFWLRLPFRGLLTELMAVYEAIRVGDGDILAKSISIYIPESSWTVLQTKCSKSSRFFLQLKCAQRIIKHNLWKWIIWAHSITKRTRYSPTINYPVIKVRIYFSRNISKGANCQIGGHIYM